MNNKGKYGVLFFVILLLGAIFTGVVSAHELWIEVESIYDGEELKIDVLWGHFGDYLDSASYEDFELYVRTPEGQVKELALEGRGVQGRAYLEPQETGQYLFWALRRPSTFTPAGGVTTLSVQMAKTAYQHGAGSGTAGEPVGMPLEIVSVTDLIDFSGGSFTGSVLLEGEPVEARITADGPSHEFLEGASSADGSFALSLDSPGTWLIKANVGVEEAGTHNEVAYEMVSRTTTLVFNVGGQ